MVMVRGFVLGLLAAALAVPIGLYRWGLDFLERGLALLAPEPPLSLAGGYAEFTGWGSPLDRSLQHSLRHEAGMRTRAAPRHI